MSLSSSVMQILYPPPDSALITAMSVMGIAAFTNVAISEIKGKNMKYSKFCSTDEDDDEKHKKKRKLVIPSKRGMLLCYAPAFVAAAGAASLTIFSGDGLRFFIVTSALTIHYLKRLLEVLFIHRYSGGMTIDASITISISYFIYTATMIYSQYLCIGHQEPSINLTYMGVALFVVGLLGNLYHHIILSTLRKEGEKVYKIPEGGLFGVVVCPHYLFEILGFWGLSCMSQTIYGLLSTLGTTILLIGRSYATRKWYISKFEDFPKNSKALIPFLF
ncbi:steroid 5-alpha-reductase DET2-like [Impatiens glandulifera]|uniref:steroid 5-alpha-reductase DET2-like n=1 Tax=Impatiens glandulifera TaxID=253017 RepID=UPI001FB10D91|nr:steroid 5-alpha-reductase DET2-like [Impatiens glandulifera]